MKIVTYPEKWSTFALNAICVLVCVEMGARIQKCKVEKNYKSKHLNTDAITLKVKNQSLVRITLNEMKSR